MATTYFDYDGDGSETLFAITFDYLEDEHVTVELDGVATTAFTINTVQPTKRVEMNTPPGNGVNVRIRRKSQPDTNLVDFVNGSVLTESELDRAYLHNRYLAEEISELNDQSLQIEAGGTQWDAKGLKIKNVGTPTLTTDASTKDYVDSKVNQVSSGASSPPTKWVFTGTAGANTTYDVTGAEVNGDTAYDVSIDGAVKEPTTDYTVDPDTDTLTIVPTLSGGEDIVVIERGFGVAVTGTIGSSQIQNGAVTDAKLQDGAVTDAKLDTNAVTSSKIQADAVDGSKIADDSIDSEHYVDGSIDTAHIANNQITAAKISTTDPIFNVQSTGKVGIGTTSPDAKLDLQASATGHPFYIRTGAGANDNLFLFENPTEGPQLRMFEKGTGNIALKLSTHDDSYFNGGKVGIGTGSPLGKLSIEGSTASDYKTHIVFNNTAGTKDFAIGAGIQGDTNNGFAVINKSDDSAPLYIADDDKVGIGTTSPSAPLEVTSTTGGVILPRLTDTEMNAVSNPTNGEIIYNTTRNQFWGYANGIWQNL